MTMARCCGGGCSCKIEGGLNIDVTGVGSSNDPFVVATDLSLTVLDTDVINLAITGAGTASSPWVVSAGFASTAQLDDIPDVNAAAPTNAQVLGWDSSTSKWTPRAPTTAASGSVVTDSSLTGDGSGGSPLQVSEAVNGGLTTASGLGLNDATKNQLVRKFADSAARAAAAPAPTLNSLSALDSVPGKVDYWTGAAWTPIESAIEIDGTAQELLALSGSYAANLQVTMLVRKFTGTTATDGTLTIVPNSMISTRAGILACTVTVTGAQAYLPVVAAGTDYLYITARRVDDGAVLASQSITGQFIAYVY